MSRLTDLISQAKAKAPALGQEIEKEFKVLASRRSFGLNFERHRPDVNAAQNPQLFAEDSIRVLLI